jgi:hypothetical protein
MVGDGEQVRIGSGLPGQYCVQRCRVRLAL